MKKRAAIFCGFNGTTIQIPRLNVRSAIFLSEAWGASARSVPFLSCQAAALPFLVVRAILDPLNLSLPQPPGASQPRIKIAWKTPLLREFADRARASLTAFAIAWLDDLAGNRDQRLR